MTLGISSRMHGSPKKLLGYSTRRNFRLVLTASWFESIMDEGALRYAYSQKQLSMAQLRELASQPSDDLPSTNFSR